MEWLIRPVRVAMLAALLAAQPLAALTSGDDALELKVDFLANGPVSLTPPKVDEARKNALKVLVILRANQQSSSEVLPLLDDLARRYPAVKIVAVSPDSLAEVKKLFAAEPPFTFAAAHDRSRESTRLYMGSGAVFPKAFAIDYRGRVIWDGEVIDLTDMLEEFAAGKFDADRQKKIAPQLVELQSRLRSGEDRMAEYAMRRVLNEDPANAAALRMRIFMLESSGRARDAWNLIEGQLRKAPQAPRLYLMLLDIASRNGEFAGEVARIGERYLAAVPADPRYDSTLGWLLMTRYPFDGTLLKQAGLLAARSLAAIAGQPEVLNHGDLYQMTALYNSRIGRLDQALAYQRRATALLEKLAPHRVAASRAFERYYEAAAALGK